MDKERSLVMIEVSAKQTYIFSSNKLRDNMERSKEIAYVTGEDFALEQLGDIYDSAKNLVYTGGGHIIFQFNTHEQAVSFSKAYTLKAKKLFPEMELFSTVWDKAFYDGHPEYQVKNPVTRETLTYAQLKPGDVLKELSKKMERKKAIRNAAFRRNSFGVEALDINKKPVVSETPQHEIKTLPSGLTDCVENSMEYAKDINSITAGGENSDRFIAIVVIDGNAMGRRVTGIYDQCKDSWEECCDSMRRFSDETDYVFHEAFYNMCTVLKSRGLAGIGTLPLRPIILAGDDICFVAAGSLGLACAQIFLEQLAKLPAPVIGVEKEWQKHFSACAGVSIVHAKYPFYEAYEIAEDLLSGAKKYAASIDDSGSVSAMDWHIGYGRMRDSVAELRGDYYTEDTEKTSMTLRPVTVVVPDSVCPGRLTRERSIQFENEMCRALKEASAEIARAKLKGLRTALKQGKIETEFYLKDRRIEAPMLEAVEAACKAAGVINTGINGVFSCHSDIDRCLIYDAIEMMEVTAEGDASHE